MRRTVVLFVLGLGVAQTAAALNIVVTNDDGFETANIRALQARLREAGHDVLVAAPTQNNSGKGGAMNFLTPVTPLAKASRWGTVPAGAAGVGVAPDDGDVFYVDGTPVMSLLFGLDVVAARRWGGPPDLVISGPNEGNNTGHINNSSGTVNNALYGINRGIPSIAVSYAGATGRSFAALTEGAVEYDVAEVVVRIVGQLEDTAQPHQPLLPKGVGLNVNIPTLTRGQGASVPLALSRLGLATTYAPVFFEKLSDSALAKAYGLGSVNLPGISMVAPGETLPAGVVVPGDQDPKSEGNVVAGGKVSISVIQGLPQAEQAQESRVGARLGIRNSR